MKTQISSQGNTIIVSMNGKLDFETHIPLREDLQALLRKTRDGVPKQIIFNLKELEFIGSSGISAFIKTLKEFGAQSPNRPKYCHVKSEFKRIMSAFDENQSFEFYDSEDRALQSYSSKMDH